MPDLTDDESQEPVVSAVEVQEQLSQFQESTRNNVRDVRHEITSLERRVQLAEKARSDSWEVISQRLNSMVGDSVGALSDRLTDLEQAVQSRRTTPVTDASASQVTVEALASVEQAFTHEVGRMKDEYDKSMLRQCDLLERLDLSVPWSLWPRNRMIQHGNSLCLFTQRSKSSTHGGCSF